MGQASAGLKRKVREKFIRALRRVEAQEISREKYFNNRKNDQKNDQRCFKTHSI